jgi:hypothetical protein
MRHANIVTLKSSGSGRQARAGEPRKQHFARFKTQIRAIIEHLWGESVDLLENIWTIG